MGSTTSRRLVKVRDLFAVDSLVRVVDERSLYHGDCGHVVSHVAGGRMLVVSFGGATRAAFNPDQVALERVESTLPSPKATSFGARPLSSTTDDRLDALLAELRETNALLLAILGRLDKDAT